MAYATHAGGQQHVLPQGMHSFLQSEAMSLPNYTRAQELPALLQQRIAILDGAMGTMIQRFKLGEAQYRGEGYTGADGAGDRF